MYIFLFKSTDVFGLGREKKTHSLYAISNQIESTLVRSFPKNKNQRKNIQKREKMKCKQKDMYCISCMVLIFRVLFSTYSEVVDVFVCALANGWMLVQRRYVY